MTLNAALLGGLLIQNTSGSLLRSGMSLPIFSPSAPIAFSRATVLNNLPLSG